MNVFIPIETASRELPYKTYLSALLSNKGFRCYLGSKSSILDLIENSKDYIYLDKGFHDGVSQDYFDLIKKNNGLIFSLDEEGGVDYADHRTIKHRYSKQLFDYADHVFFWGQKQLNIVEFNIKNLSKVSVSGHPRFQLLSAQYRNIFMPEVQVLNKKYGSYVLINTNMGFGNNINGDDFVKRNYGDRFIDIDEIIAFDKSKCTLMIKAIKSIAREQGLNIVLRPHPEEDINYYKKNLENYSNVFVIYEGSVVPWILASEYIIHPDCTTAIEAVFLDKKAFSLLPKDYNPEIVTLLPLEVSVKLEGVDGLPERISSELNNELIPEGLRQLLNNYFSTEINSLSHIVEKFEKQLKIDSESISKPVILRQILKKSMLNLYNVIVPHSMMRVNRLSLNKTKGLRISWIRSLLNEFNQVDTRVSSVKVKKIHKELYMFRKS